MHLQLDDEVGEKALRSEKNSHRHPVGVALGGLAAALVLVGQVAAQSTSHYFDIPEEDAVTALQAFAQQAGKQVLFPYDAVFGRRTMAIKGDLPDREVLNRLASSAGLVVTSDDGHTITLRPAPKEGGTGTTVSGDGELEEVVVTAQKRAEKLQDVPASVSAVSGGRLREMNLGTLSDYAAYLPGVNVTPGGAPGMSTISLRGIVPIGGSVLVGMYIDDTPVGAASISSGDLGLAVDMLPYDLDRLEVLRGPQGTLYGAGAMGGLVKYVLVAPDLERFEGRVGADTMAISGAGRLGWGGRASANIPLIDNTLAVRMSAYDQHTPGYVDNTYTGVRDGNDDRQYGGRFAALWRPMDNLSIKVNALWTRTEADDLGLTTLTPVPFVPTSSDVYLVQGTRPTGLTQSHAFAQRFSKSLDYYSSTANWDLGAVDVISSTTWMHSTGKTQSDFSYLYGQLFPILTNGAVPAGLAKYNGSQGLEKFVQEIRFVSPGGRKLEWIGGAFYTHESNIQIQPFSGYDLNYQPIAAFTPYFEQASLPALYKEYALFGDVTYHLTDRFDVTAGGRYAHNNQTYTQITSGLFLTTDEEGKSSQGVFTWMFSPRFQVTPDIMAYARVASGYRPGGPNLFAPGVPPTVNSDTLKNYEIGIKSELFQRKLLLNLSAYYIDWKGIQLSVTINDLQVGANGGGALSKGLEFESVYSPIPRLHLGLNAAYTHAYLTQLAAGTEPFVLGEQLPQTPRWSASLTADYSFPVAANWNGNLDGGWHYAGREYSAPLMYYSLGGSAAFAIPASSSLDLNASIANERWTFKLFAKNLTNSRALQSGQVLTNPAGVPAQIDAAFMQPRTVGVGVDVSF